MSEGRVAEQGKKDRRGKKTPERVDYETGWIEFEIVDPILPQVPLKNPEG